MAAARDHPYSQVEVAASTRHLVGKFAARGISVMVLP
jgi:hypothetical protein